MCHLLVLVLSGSSFGCVTCSGNLFLKSNQNKATTVERVYVYFYSNKIM